MMSECTHTTPVPGYWEDLTPRGHHMDDDDEFDDCEWVDGYDESTTVDIDLHRYRCTQCGEVFYYSNAARRFYENGETSNIRGLDNAETSS